MGTLRQFVAALLGAATAVAPVLPIAAAANSMQAAPATNVARPTLPTQRASGTYQQVDPVRVASSLKVRSGRTATVSFSTPCRPAGTQWSTEGPRYGLGPVGKKGLNPVAPSRCLEVHNRELQGKDHQVCGHLVASWHTDRLASHEPRCTRGHSVRSDRRLLAR